MEMVKTVLANLKCYLLLIATDELLNYSKEKNHLHFLSMSRTEYKCLFVMSKLVKFFEKQSDFKQDNCC